MLERQAGARGRSASMVSAAPPFSLRLADRLMWQPRVCGRWASFGRIWQRPIRADRLDRAVLERLVASIRRVLAVADGEPVVERAGVAGGEIEIEAVFELGVAHVVKVLWNRLGIAAAISVRIAERQL